jgi:hypothetical protein
MVFCDCLALSLPWNFFYSFLTLLASFLDRFSRASRARLFAMTMRMKDWILIRDLKTYCLSCNSLRAR